MLCSGEMRCIKLLYSELWLGHNMTIVRVKVQLQI